LNIKSANR